MSGTATELAQVSIAFEIATSKILQARVTGRLTGDAQILIESGFKDEGDYWEVFLSEPAVDHSKFKSKLVAHLSPAVHTIEVGTWPEEVSRIESLLDSALKLAFDTNESWMIKGADKQLFVRPRAAVLWLLSSRKRAALVPIGLRKYLAASPSNDPVRDGTQPAKRPDAKLSDAASALRDLYPEGPPKSVDRQDMVNRIAKKTGKVMSFSTLDRARKAAWPS